MTGGRWTRSSLQSVPDLSRVLIVIPAWNEEASITAVISEVGAALPGARVVVVNDGSTDATAAVARRAGAEVVDLPFNLGVGGAMRAGFRWAELVGARVVVQVDADGQHDPAEVPLLLAAIERDDAPADIVIGARFANRGDYSVRGPRRWAMKVLAGTLSRVARTRLTDTTSGFRASGPRAIALFARYYPAEYLGDTIESLVIASRAGCRIEQVGVAMRPRSGGTPSHRPLKAAVYLARACLALGIALTRPAQHAPRLQPALEPVP